MPRLLLLLLALLLPLSAIEVAFDGRQVVFAAPEGTPAVGVLVWFHGGGDDPGVEAGWFRGHGLVQRGLAVAAPPARLDWNEETDRLFATRLCRELRQRLKLEPRQLIVGGSGSGAAFAMRLATDYQDSLCGGLLLVRGGLGGRWREAGANPPLVGIYANANDPVVPIASLRTVERRLQTTGYQTRFVSALAEQGWGDELVGLVEQVCAGVGIPLAARSTP